MHISKKLFQLGLGFGLCEILTCQLPYFQCNYFLMDKRNYLTQIFRHISVSMN